MALGSYFELPWVLQAHWNSLARGCRTTPATQGRREALPASPRQALCGSRRGKANSRPTEEGKGRPCRAVGRAEAGNDKSKRQSTGMDKKIQD